MKELFCKYLNEQCSPQEVKELLACFSAEDESALRTLITDSLKDLDVENEDEKSRSTPVIDKILAVIKTQIKSEKEKVAPNAMVRVPGKLQQPK